ncbi:MAG: antiviral RADAR system adenosine triphosphatase RdrA [Telluria sp.]
MLEPRETIHFPIDTVDQAFVASRRNLLAGDAYEAIAAHLRTALAKSRRIVANTASVAAREAFDQLRSHEAVLLDGGRGTGKSSVLVNLSRYVDGIDDLREELLILKPVDPTLLENGDNLLLNVIVAALLRDQRVREALRDSREGTTEFYTELESLGSALEGIQKIGSEFGLDRLQAFVENQELAEHVHMLFYRALRLTGKKLVVLPIDDVDTSLELAFDNVDAVRKYMTSPCVIPIISGDLDLYDDIIYRRFAHRLTRNGMQADAGALQRARHLAEEYARKVLPLPRRIRLPELRTYLDNPGIHLAENGRELMPLPVFKHWLEALLNDRVNGEDNSARELPLSTVREFAQFVQACRNLLGPLKNFFDSNEVDDDEANGPVMMRRRLLMSTDVAQAVGVFAEQFDAAYAIRSNDGTRTQRTAREQAYRMLRDLVADADTAPAERIAGLRKHWNTALAAYAIHQRTWGSTYLLADANVYLLRATGNVLGHDLFRPQRHSAQRYAHFDMGAEFAASWRNLLTNKAPEQWLNRLPKTTLLSYPGPETGRHAGPLARGDTDLPIALAHRLLIHWSYYSPSARGDLLLCGRVFELLMASLTCDLTQSDLSRILHQPPFYSLAEFARTKTLDVGSEIADDDARGQDAAPPSAPGDDDGESDTDLAELVVMVNQWRRRVQIARPNAWFVFVVMNKFFSQVAYINRNTGQYLASGEILNLAMQAFNLFWSAVGSFEKGPMFGLPQVVATVNMSGTSATFEQHPLYRQNISPFLQLRGNDGYHDFGTGSYTYALESHPLRRLWHDALAAIQRVSPQQQASTAPSGSATPRSALHEIDRRIDRHVNEMARQLGLDLKASAIARAPAESLTSLVALVEERCHQNPAMLERLRSVRQSTDLPKNSGRRRLQRVMERLDR